MKSFLKNHNLLTVVACLIILGGCKQPETVIIAESPTAVAPNDTVDTNETRATFRKLVVGEYNTISTMDPLFADNATTMRAVQLVFEGLVRLDSTDSVVPGLAKNWEIAEDSLRYTFTLRDDVYYQDGDIFSTGTGRKLSSDDVKFVFERMAQAGIPPKAAHLFMGIQGFEPYYQEQREIYLPSKRKLDEVTGIKAPNDSTVVFNLTYKDPEFLKKLATPLAVIYPKEAVGTAPGSFTPIGTGPFQFSSSPSDSIHIFSKFKNYYAASDVELDRVDIISNTSDVTETNLFKALSANDIHVIPQVGPQTMLDVLTDDGQLQPGYAERYTLNIGGDHEYVLRYNPAAGLSENDAQTISAVASMRTASYFNRFPQTLVTAESHADTVALGQGLVNLKDNMSTVYSDDPFIQTYLGTLSQIFSKNGITLRMVEIRTPTRNTELLFTENYPLIPDTRWNSYQPIFSFRVSQAALQRSDIAGLNFNQYPWWFDLRNVTMPALEKLSAGQ